MSFIFIYIAEAHAKDTWPIAYKYERPRPKTQEERRASSEEFTEINKEYFKNWTIAIDKVYKDEFNNTFSSWPTRFFVIKNRKLAYKAQPNEREFKFSDLEIYLNENYI